MMKNLNIGIVIVTISLMLASCGNRTEQNNSEAGRNQSATYTSAVSSEQSASSEWIGTDFPVSSAMAENNTTSQAAVKTESVRSAVSQILLQEQVARQIHRAEYRFQVVQPVQLPAIYRRQTANGLPIGCWN